jgi:hypothetical protein
VHYDGVDPSAYAVERFGARRGLQLGGIDDLDRLTLRAAYDVVVCCGMLNYLPTAVLRRGLPQVVRRTGGVAYLELFTSADDFEGDTTWPRPRTPHWYRGVMRASGLRSIGLHSYVPLAQVHRVAALEREAE